MSFELCIKVIRTNTLTLSSHRAVDIYSEQLAGTIIELIDDSISKKVLLCKSLCTLTYFCEC